MTRPASVKRKKRLIGALLVLLLLLAAGALYAGRYYRADAAALEALASDGQVLVEQTDYGWRFDGPAEDEALIFYPGGKVEETAYAPLLHELARQGVDVCLVKMPLHLAVLGVDRAEAVMREENYTDWYLGGHSLGGACASLFAAEHADELEGLILLGAYPARDLGDSLPVLLLTGTEDGVLNREKYAENLPFAGENAVEAVIEGGNHAQFGSYGAQRGDGEAAISAEDQVRETVREITGSLAKG